MKNVIILIIGGIIIIWGIHLISVPTICRLWGNGRLPKNDHGI